VRTSVPGDNDGAHTSAMPLVPWPHDTTGNPPAGGDPAGTATTPVTTTGLFCTVSDMYMTRYSVPCKPATATFCDFTSLPIVVGKSCGTE